MHMTPKTIIIGGLAVVLSVVAVVVFLPVAVFKPAPTITTNQYTALEKEGLELYKSNGCVYCHSQFTRPNDHSTSEAKPRRRVRLRQPAPAGHAAHRSGPREHRLQARGQVGGRPPARSSEVHAQLDHAGVQLSDRPQLEALVAYLNRLGNKQNASTDLMVPAEYNDKVQPYPTDIKTWDAGRKIYLERCLTCHGCSGSGDGPYANMNNARPASLRQPRFRNLAPSFFFWRLSEGVPGTVMPQWEQSLTKAELWQVIAFIQGAFMDMVPHFTDEGEMPAKYADATPAHRRDQDTSHRQGHVGDELRVLPRLRRSGRRSERTGPAAGGTELPRHRDLLGVDAPGLLLARQRIHPDARDAAVEVLVR